MKKWVAYADDSQDDVVGNFYYLKKGKSAEKKIMLIAHKDRVGFMVMKKEGQSFRAKSYGSIGAQLGEIAFSVSEKGSFGIIKKTKEPDIFLLDCTNKNVTEGDMFFLYRERFTDGERIYGAGLDNTVGVELLMQTMQEKKEYAYDTYFVLTEKEEIGGAGAKVALQKIKPDIVIVVDVTIAGNEAFPPEEFTNVVVGKGMTILYSDGMTIADRKTYERFADLAASLELPFQKAIIAGGCTDLTALDALGSDATRIAVGVPIGNIHTDSEYCSKEDIKGLKRFLLHFDEKF